jgi:hypothetical protein
MGREFLTAARIASGHHGRISRAQLLAAGVDGDRIKRWIRDGRLRPVHQGVYAVGHSAPTVLGRYAGAVLAGGGGARLSHFADAHLLRLIPGPPPRPEVTVPTTAHRRRPGIVIHRVRELPIQDTDHLHGIPILSVARTLLDLAPHLDCERLTRACHEAWHRHRTTPEDVERCISRNPHKKGIAKLRRALGTDDVLSPLEAGFLQLMREHRVPLPRTNIDVAGDKVDCHWPEHGLTVELQSYRYHATRQAFENDIARRRRSGHLPFSYGDVFDRGRQTAVEIASRLAASGATRG